MHWTAAVCRVQCTQILQCLLCAVYSSCGVCSVKCTGVQCIVYTVSVVCAVYSVQCILYIVQFFAVHMSKPVYCSEQDNISNSQEWQQDLVATYPSVQYLIRMTRMIRISQVNLLTYFVHQTSQADIQAMAVAALLFKN